MSESVQVPDWINVSRGTLRSRRRAAAHAPGVKGAGPLIDVSRETLSKLTDYVALLKKWNSKINLIGSGGDIWNRHIWDSYQLVPLLPRRAKSLVDIGSGAGLPGLVIAMATSLKVTLIERDIRKASFLREAARSLGLQGVEIKNEDAHFIHGSYDVITARALSSLADLCELALPLMGKTSICFFPKGENFASEVEEAREKWSFDLELIPSQTNCNSSIVSISKLKKKNKS